MRQADPQLSILVHQLYREVAQDTNLCFQVERSGVLRLLSFSNLELFSVDSITDIIAIYDFLIVEMAKNFVSTQSTDYDESTEIAISKSIGAFLVNCLKYYSNNFPVKIIESIALFTFHLSNSCLILTHLVDLWFQHCIQDPDIMFLVSSFKSIPADCFPLYELSKDFLFFGDNLISVSRDTLINIIMISGFSQPLRDWILRSEFPKLIITGLFSNFNQIFNSNPFVSDIESNPSFIQFNWYIDFLYDIITFSTHDQIKFVFLSVFESNFLNKVIDYYNHSHNLDSKSNTLFLLLKTFEKLLSTSGAKSNTFTFNFILNELIDSYFKKKKNMNNNSFPLLDIFTDLILSCNQLEFNTHEINSYEVSTISSLKLFNLFATLNSLDLLIELFSDSEYCYTHHNSSSVNSIIQNGSNIFPLTSKFKEIIKVNDNLKFFFFTNLTKSFELLQSNFIKTDRFGNSCERRWLSFNFKKKNYLLQFVS